MTAQISLHINVDNTTDAQLDRALTYLHRTKAQMVNIAAGAQLDRGYAFVDGLRAAMPTIKVFWRHLEDTGVWTKLSPVEWYNSRVLPRLAWAARNDIVFVTDNESSGDNTTIENYVRWQKTVMAMLHEKGLHAAVGRFATGNIREEQYALLKPMFDAFQTGDYFSPNEYFNAPGRSSSGHLYRYNLAWMAMGKPLPTAIGELGMSVDYKSGDGYHTLNMSAKDYAALVIQNFEMWYKKFNVTVFLYVIGGFGWQSFQIDGDVMTELETYAAKQDTATVPVVMPDKPAPVVAPIPAPLPAQPPQIPPPVEVKPIVTTTPGGSMVAEPAEERGYKVIVEWDNLTKSEAELLLKLYSAQQTAHIEKVA